MEDFTSAVRALRTSGGLRDTEIVCVEGCSYGSDGKPDKGTHLRLCGPRFWSLLSDGNEDLYLNLVEPLGHMAKEYQEEFKKLTDSKLDAFAEEFTKHFCHDDGTINWPQLIKYSFRTDKSIKLSARKRKSKTV